LAPVTEHSRLILVAAVAATLLLSLPPASDSDAPARRASSGALVAPGAVAATPQAVQAGTWGAAERYELGGAWLFRFDHGAGLSRGFQSTASTTGWSAASVPSTWNATDQSKASMTGTVAWYRKDFELPPAAAQSTWIVRFESVNNRVTAWLNGQPIGTHAGAFLPFELVLPAGLLKGHGANHLVLRVDSRRAATDLPKVGLWWNYGGILRTAYLERVDRVGFASVQVLPRLPCRSCDATIEYRVMLRNYSSATQNVRLSSTYGGLAVDLGKASIGGGATQTFIRQATLAKPQLWSPASPHLYDVKLDLRLGTQAGGSEEWTQAGRYFLRSGVRSIEVSPQGTLLLNGQKLNFRGVGLIEDSKQLGSALSDSIDRRSIAEAKNLGATAIRSQYPLDEHLEELADENGLMLWSEIPVDKIPPRYLADSAFRDRAVAKLRENILTNSSHPSIIVWSIANELAPQPDSAQGTYISRAVAAAHALDPTRPVGLAVAAYPSSGCQARYYAPLEVIGLNDYFGWYPGPVGDLKNRDRLSGYLDAMRSCYRGKALVVTEFGAEANRTGPVGERGTYAFQQDFVKFHLSVFASKPWLGGAIYWALQEFRVRPGWGGGNPRPTPPIHTKGLISFSGSLKPAYYDVREIYRATTQLGAP
jgi:beta-galactosidase/beta-glucuronidase